MAKPERWHHERARPKVLNTCCARHRAVGPVEEEPEQGPLPGCTALPGRTLSVHAEWRPGAAREACFSGRYNWGVQSCAEGRDCS